MELELEGSEVVDESMRLGGERGGESEGGVPETSCMNSVSSSTVNI